MSQYQPTVLITTQQSHPWTISAFNGLNGNVLLTFKCDAAIALHGLLCSRDHIYAAAIDRPSIYVWNLNSRVCFSYSIMNLICLFDFRIEITKK
jgi:hypothetical protein